MNIRKYMFFLGCLIYSVTDCNAKNIIVDLGFTAINQSNLQRLNAVGYKVLFLATLHPFSISSRIKDTLYDIYNCVDGRLFNATTADCLELPKQSDAEGSAMPKLMQLYFLGKLTFNDAPVRTALNTCLDTYEHYCIPAFVHKDVVANTINWMGNPQEYAQAWIINDDTIRLLEDLAAVKNKNGEQEHQFFILSNFDADTFNELLKRPDLQRLFKLFKPENIYVSGIRHDIKPRASFFNMILKEHNLQANETVFLDDEPQNIRVAREEIGLHAILFDKKAGDNYQRIHKELENLGFFNQEPEPKKEL